MVEVAKGASETLRTVAAGVSWLVPPWLQAKGGMLCVPQRA